MNETLELKAKLDEIIGNHQVEMRTFSDMICAIFERGESMGEGIDYPKTIRNTVNLYLDRLEKNIDSLFQ